MRLSDEQREALYEAVNVYRETLYRGYKPLRNGDPTRVYDAVERIASEYADTLLAEVERRIERERDAARAAYRAASSDHFADDYSRWVGHAEAGTNVLGIIREVRQSLTEGGEGRG